MGKEKSLPLPVGANVYDYVRRNRKQAMQIVGIAVGLMVLLTLLGIRKVDFKGVGMVWTLLHPLQICILVAGATLAGAKFAEQTYRFALAVTLTIVAGILISTATITYIIHNYFVKLSWSTWI
jgi:hypothetical protein